MSFVIFTAHKIPIFICSKELANTLFCDFLIAFQSQAVVGTCIKNSLCKSLLGMHCISSDYASSDINTVYKFRSICNFICLFVYQLLGNSQLTYAIVERHNEPRIFTSRMNLGRTHCLAVKSVNSFIKGFHCLWRVHLLEFVQDAFFEQQHRVKRLQQHVSICFSEKNIKIPYCIMRYFTVWAVSKQAAKFIMVCSPKLSYLWCR